MDQKEYRSMIGSLLYLTTTRPDIQFTVYLCARFKSSSRTLHHQAVKRIMRYFVSNPNLVFGFWLPPLFLFAVTLMQIMLAVVLRGSPLPRLVSFLDLLLCLGLLASSLPLPNPP
jgi:hypothetical protein